MHPTVVIVGLGEVGKPLLEIMKSRYRTFAVDINQPASVSQCDVMHICFPFKNEKFVGRVIEYIHQYQPALTVINSTVAPGTTRRIAVESGTAVVHSPVRGKHARMQEEMLHYTKFIGALDLRSGQRVQLLIPGDTFHTARLVGRTGWFLGASTEWPGVVPADVELGNLDELCGKYPTVAADLRAIADSVRQVAPAGGGPR